MKKMPSTLLNSAAAAEKWKAFSRDYEHKVFSLSSFSTRRERIVREVLPGVALDEGCGPLGLLLRDIASLPGTSAIGADFSWEMVAESRSRTNGHSVRYVVADNQSLPFRPGSIDTIVAVNSFLPETRAEVDGAFQEAARALRPHGKLVAVLPAFEMSLIARDYWGMDVQLDVSNHREWDTAGWQCFYTLPDIAALMHRYGFRGHSVERMTFSSQDELTHVRHVYRESLRNVPPNRIAEQPLFEHLLIAER